ncbi:Transcription elongation factor spt6 [Coemansia sp. RSA 1365]|nr:Transcription elongation factor spt6 [Coemansia sp. RSA 1365]
MSDLSDLDGRGPDLNHTEGSDSDEGSDTFSNKRHRYSDEEDEEEEDENDDELRREGFVVDDDMDEDDVSDSQEQRRRRRKKKRRRHAEQSGISREDLDALDEEDLALVEENRYGRPASPQEKRPAPRHKRLIRRGRGGGAHRSIDEDLDDARAESGDDDLRAELKDLIDTGGDAVYSDDEVRDGSRRTGARGRDEDLGLFDNDDEGEISADDYRAARRAERAMGGRRDKVTSNGAIDEYSHEDIGREEIERSYNDEDLRGAEIDAERSAGGPERGGAMASFLAEGLDAIDDETWMELQDIFGNGEEYAFAMEAPTRDQNGYKEKTLADVFEPAELEAKMMTQRDEDIRTTDIPERMQMRATGAESLRPLTEDEIEEETTWVVRQLHAWLTRQEALRARNDSSGADWNTNGESAARPEEEAPVLFRHADFINERFLAAVLSVLKLLSQDFYEVPFIAQHRREVFVTPEENAEDGGALHGEEPPTREWLSMDDLWKLYDFDLQFRGLLSSRRYLQNMIRRLKGEGLDTNNTEEGSANGGKVISVEDEAYANEMIATASCVEDITDVTEWLQTQHSQTIRSWSHGRSGIKRARTLGLLEQARREGTDRFVERVGISARNVGDNIQNPGRHRVLDPPEEPLDVARDLVGVHFASPDIALKASKAMYAQQLALDPQVRRFVRTYCDEHACIVVRPTDRGFSEITHEEHPAFAFKFLKQKPVAEFANSAQYIEISKAVDEGLVRMQFTLSTEYPFDSRNFGHDDRVLEEDRQRTTSILVDHLTVHVTSSAATDSAWNTLRRSALSAAVSEYVLPQMWREIDQRLQQQAFDYVADMCRRAMERRIDVQAARNMRMKSGERPRVVVVGGGGFDASSRGALRVVMVDEHGECKEDFSADSMRKQTGMMESDGDGVALLLDLLARESVDVVAVVGMNLQTRRLFQDVQELVNEHCSQTSDDIMVTYASDEVARLWWDCDRAREELPNLRREERYCVCVARTLQDPANEYAMLGRDMLHLPLHKAQRDVDQSALFTVVERAFVNVVNRVGVDINELALHPHSQSVLQYVSGLGPRKAYAILSKISTGDNLLESRSDLIVRRLCTRTVFVNCASFLRIRPAALDVLDDTRIHPEDYDLARKMALDALDIEDDGEEDTSRRGRKKSDGPSRYVAEVMRKSPEKLDDLDLVKYAEELKRLLDVHKLETLKFIKQELQHPNDDPRVEFQPPDDALVLHMLTGETIGDTLKDDGTSMVSGTIVRVQPRFAIARLDSGLEGFINVANVTDYRLEEVSDELSPGQAIVAVVKRIDLEKMSLELSMRKSDVDEACGRGQKLAPDSTKVDKYFDIEAESLVRERAKAQKLKSTARMRTIPHPLFKPLNGREAEQYLASRPRGDCVIRPSSRGVDHIAITWKVGDGLFQHIDVLEQGKTHDGALGTTFVVGEMAYTDLDELLALHVDPIMRKLEEVKRNPKFYDPENDPLYVSEPVADVLGPNDYTQEHKEKRVGLWEKRVAHHLDTLARSTGRGSYCISLSLPKPGALTLAFKPTPDYRGIKTWTARVEPNEYKLGSRGRYPNINGLINGFKMMQMKSVQQGSAANDVAGSRSQHHARGGDSRGDGRGGGWGGTNSWGASHSQQTSRGGGSGWGDAHPATPSAQWNSNATSGWNV